MTQDEVRGLFEYHDKGLYWKEDRHSNKVKGLLAGAPDSRGYRCVHINKKIYKMHRLVYLYHHGYFPKVVDHINGDTLDNSIDNLRDVSSSVNAQNRSHFSGNKTGIRNVSYSSKSNKYVVRVCIDYVSRYMGEFSTLEEATTAALAARKTHHVGYTERTDQRTSRNS